MSGDDPIVVADQDGICEAKSLYAVGYLPDLLFGMCASIAGRNDATGRYSIMLAYFTPLQSALFTV
jgi:hypothetical protein